MKITRAENTRIAEVDFDNIPFGKIFSDHMFVADYINGQWQNMEVKAFGYMKMHPAMLALHYGQSIFEGMKATITHDGQPMLFRPMDHAKRLNRSAQRMCMPEFPEEKLIEALEILVGLDKEWIPKNAGSALYIRPLLFATDEFIGVRESDNYKLVIFTQPVGPYYRKPVKLLCEKRYIRAAQGGLGEAKAAGNYGGSLLPARLAKQKGYDQVLWLDAKEFRYIQEVGTMNIVFVYNDKIVTPSTTGTILKGITRDSVLTLLRDKGHQVEEKLLDINDVFQAYRQGRLKEVLGVGTAAVVSFIGEINNEGDIIRFEEGSNTLGKEIYDDLNTLRSGLSVDHHGWLHPVPVPATVS